MEAVARLLCLAGHVPLRDLLVGEHERVAAAVAVVDREEVPGEDALQPRVALRLLRRQLALGGAAGAAVLRARRLGGALVVVELARPVLAPLRRVGVVLGDLDELHVGVLRLALALADVHEQRGDADRHEGEDAGDEGDEERAILLGLVLGGHEVLLLDGVAAVRVDQRRWPTERWQRTHDTSAAVRDVVDERGVAPAAVGLDDLGALRPRLDRVGVAAERERHRVVVAVDRLHDVLRDRAGRRVAVVARRDEVVRRRLPAGVVARHDVAVGAGRRVVAEIRRTLRVVEGVGADAEREPAVAASASGIGKTDMPRLFVMGPRDVACSSAMPERRRRRRGESRARRADAPARARERGLMIGFRASRFVGRAHPTTALSTAGSGRGRAGRPRQALRRAPRTSARCGGSASALALGRRRCRALRRPSPRRRATAARPHRRRSWGGDARRTAASPRGALAPGAVRNRTPAALRSSFALAWRRKGHARKQNPALCCSTSPLYRDSQTPSHGAEASPAARLAQRAGVPRPGVSLWIARRRRRRARGGADESRRRWPRP